MAQFQPLATPLAGAVRQVIHLRWYQAKAFEEIKSAWAQGFPNVLAVLPTGAGKTVLFSEIVRDHGAAACVIAHRQELVYQICAALNRVGVRFRIIAPKLVVQKITELLHKKQGVCFYDPNALVAVAGVDTLNNIDKGQRKHTYERWCKSVSLWVMDEAHHVQANNKWGKATKKFPDTAKGLGVTATPERGDGCGLGRDPVGSGLFDYMVLGPDMAYLIQDGYLTPYQIWTVPCTIQYEQIDVGASGDFVQAKLVAAEDADGKLVGNIVETYLKRTPGKRAIAFVSSVARSELLAEAFRAKGVRAKALDGNTDPAERSNTLEAFERGELDVLTNCALFGEGTDIPAVEVVIMGTATASLVNYTQWFGRMLRLFLTKAEAQGYDQLTSEQRRAVIANSAKPFGILLDHGGNVLRHDGPPDIPKVWTLAHRPKRTSANAPMPYRMCPNPGWAPVEGVDWVAYRLAGWSNEQMIEHRLLYDRGVACIQPYPRLHRSCPHCGFIPEPQGRSEPGHVDGDLELLDPETLAELLAARNAALLPEGEYWAWVSSQNFDHFTSMGKLNRHKEKLAEALALESAMGWFGGFWKTRGDSDTEIQRRFYIYFRVDVVTACTLPRADMAKLRDQIVARLSFDGFVIPGYSDASVA